MKNKIRYLLIVSFLLFMSLYFGGFVKKGVLGVNDRVIEQYYSAKNAVIDTINEHFNQVEEIRFLRAKNEALEQSSALLSTF